MIEEIVCMILLNGGQRMNSESEYLQLQNGSDIRGIAMEGIEGQDVNLTRKKVETIAESFVIWLAARINKKPDELRVSIGMDSRLSGPDIKKAAISGLTHQGANVYDFGIASTPAMFMSTVTEGYMYDGAIMITASHLPFNRNGLKFFTKGGGLDKEDITDILTAAASMGRQNSNKYGKLYNVDFISVYSKMLVKKIIDDVDDKRDVDHPLTGFKIVVDAGNGAGGFYVEKVLKPLGADTEGSLFLDPDGRFMNHIPNPENEDAMSFISKAVTDNHADLGIIFDADVDRAGAVSKSGIKINRNRLIALMSAIILEEHPSTYIVTDSVTSTGLKKFIEKHGGHHHRFKRGYRNVINEAIRLNEQHRECCLAMETSGHGALKENYFLDDGAYLITKIIIKMAKLRMLNEGTIDDLLSDLEEPAEAKEFRLDISQPDYSKYGNRILQELEDYSKSVKGWVLENDNYEGVRVSAGDGWFLLRMSLHDPLMPLNIESNTNGGVRIIASQLAVFLRKYQYLDISSIEKYIE